MQPMKSSDRSRSRSLASRLAACLASAICLLVPAAGTKAQEQTGSETVVWSDNYADALREAKLTQKPIFLEFRCAP